MKIKFKNIIADSGALLSAELNHSENDVTSKAVTSSAERQNSLKTNTSN